MEYREFIFSKLIPRILRILGLKEDSWNFLKVNTIIQSLIMIPFKKFKRFKRTVKFVENQYDNISGLYIQDNYYKSKERYSIVNGRIKKISSIENMKLIRQEIRDLLSDIEFKTVLEVGAGELTSLEDIQSHFSSDIDFYGVDLSLNRLFHGLDEYKKKHKKLPLLSKSNAVNLPFPDHSFDLVFTRHTLEQMPKIFEKALDEIIRVSKKHIFLFEPSFELGGLSQKLKMINSDYVRGIPRYLDIKKDLISLEKNFLMMNSANPLNHTACFKITKNNGNQVNSTKKIEFVCPLTKTNLIKKNNYFFSEKASKAYPIIDNIPILDPDYAFRITNFHE